MLVELPTPATAPPAPPTSSSAVDLLILGAGWTSTFLIPLLEKEKVSYAATTRDGRDGTIPFTFDPGSEAREPYAALPPAATVLITFPLAGKGQAKLLTSLYGATHSDDEARKPPRYVQLGVTSIWKNPGWSDENSPYDASDPRAVAEDELLGGRAATPATVLSLAGLYGGARQPRHWVDRVARSKEDLRGKGALHMIHGADVARAVLAVHRRFTPGKRWLLCDVHVYDWWELVQDWAGEAVRSGGGGDNSKEADRDDCSREAVARIERQKELLAWVGELMVEESVRALPRDPSSLGRTLDGRGFWKEMGVWPIQGRVR